MKSKSFGLDIGSTSIKAVWLRKDREEVALESVVASPLSSKGLFSEAFYDQQAMGEVIKAMLSDAGIIIDGVNVSLPESQVYSRVLEMPELSERELQAALVWEMEQQIPLPFDQVRTDWQVLEHIQENNKKAMKVLIVAAPLKLIEKYNKVMGIAGITPQAVETEIISVHRSLNPLFTDSGADIIIHLGASTTDVAIVKNKIISLVFTVPLGGIAITRAISLDLGIDLTQAENFKKAYGLSQETFEGKIGKSLTPILDSIIGDIQKAILLFREKNNGQTINQIILSGGSALLPKVDIFFTDKLNAQVVIGNSWQLQKIANVPNEVDAEGPSYNVVVGLALRDIL